MTISTRVLGVGVFVFISAGVAWFFDDFWVLLFTTGIVYAVIFCSLTVITGMAGLLSLSQAAFAGIGAFTTAQLVDRYDLQVVVAILIGAALAALVGGVFALPVLRLEGLYLALATLAFAAMFQFVILPQKWAGGQNLQIPRPIIGPIDFSSTRAYYFLCLAFLGLVGGAVLLIKRGTVGRYLDALRGSEIAAVSIGIDPRRARVTAGSCSSSSPRSSPGSTSRPYPTPSTRRRTPRPSPSPSSASAPSPTPGTPRASSSTRRPSRWGS